MPFLTASWEDLPAALNSSSAVAAADGTFRLLHLAPGHYTLTAAANSMPDNAAPPPLSATRTLEVGSENVEGVILNMAPTPLRDLKGTITFDRSIPADQVIIRLQRVAFGANRSLTAKVQPDGSFVIPGVWPGRYIAERPGAGRRSAIVPFRQPADSAAAF